MSRPQLFAVLAVMLAATPCGAASAKPNAPPIPASGATGVLEVGHHGYGSHGLPGQYSHYRRHHGFSLRLGWGYPSYGYPWAYPAPVYAYPVRPLVVMPAPVVPVFPHGAPAAWTAEWYGYCAQKYRSFDSRTGLYITYSGERRMCR
jgi:hypothetical protein